MPSRSSVSPHGPIPPMSLADALAANLRARRGDLSQEAFARKLGISRPTLTRLENGAQNTTLKTLQTICRKSRCEVGDLFEAPRAN
jgi:DNA-binding XRE family transcriptional regulator